MCNDELFICFVTFVCNAIQSCYRHAQLPQVCPTRRFFLTKSATTTVPHISSQYHFQSDPDSLVFVDWFSNFGKKSWQGWMMRGTGCYSLYKLQPASGCHSLYQAATACRGEGWGRGEGCFIAPSLPTAKRQETNQHQEHNNDQGCDARRQTNI